MYQRETKENASACKKQLQMVWRGKKIPTGTTSAAKQSLA